MTFTEVERAECVLCHGGKYRMAKVYQRHGLLYAGYDSSFVGLYKKSFGVCGTTVKGMTYELSTDANVVASPITGRLELGS